MRINKTVLQSANTAILFEVGLSLLAHASMPLKFWDEAFTTAVYLINRTPLKVINFETPLDRLFNLPPDYSLVRTFGCACWPNLQPYNARKLAFCSQQCVFLGYSTLHKGFKCLDISAGRVYISRDVVFDESSFPFAKLHSNPGACLRSEVLLLPPHLFPPSSLLDPGGNIVHDQPMIDDPNHTNQDTEHAAGQNTENNGENSDENDAGTAADDHVFVQSDDHGSMQGSGGHHTGADPDASMQASSGGAESEDEQDTGSVGASPIVQPAVHSPVHAQDSSAHQSGSSALSNEEISSTTQAPAPGPVTRSRHGIRKPKKYADGTIRYACLTDTREPDSLQYALRNKNWKLAMDKEYEALVNNKTWHLVPPKRGTNIIDCKWVYKIKRKADGTVDRYKARLVAKRLSSDMELTMRIPLVL